MLLANVFALFEQGLRFRALGELPDEIVSIAPHRWDDAGEVGVAISLEGRTQTLGGVNRLLLLLRDANDVVETGQLQIVAALPVEDPGVSIAIIALASEQPVTLDRWLGKADRGHRLEVAALEEEARRDLADLREQLADEIESLRTQLVQAHKAKGVAEEMYRTARTSSAYRLGSLLGESARHPMRAVTGLPKGLSEIVRDRPEAAAQAAKAAELVAAQDAPAATAPLVLRRTDLVHQAWSAPSIPRVSELGVRVAYLAHPFYGGARRSAWQFDVWPGDHLRALETTLPDAVVIDASATLPGSPWAGSGNGVDQGAAAMIVDAVRWSHRAGIPTVFRWDLPSYQAPVFSRIASSCDLVVTTERGGLESAPLLRHGVVPGKKTPRESMRTLTAFRSAELGLDGEQTGEVPGATTPEGWVRHIADRAIVHSPEDTRHVLSKTGVAVFPETSGVPLTLLEAAVSGAVVVAPGRNELPFVVDAATVVWDDADLISLQDRAREERVATAWAIRERFSTLAETRTIGRWLGVGDLSDIGGITAILAATDSSEPAAISFVDEMAGLIDVLIVIGEGAGARRITARAADHRIEARIASGDGELADQIRSTTKPSWWVWPVDPVNLQGAPADVLRGLVTELGSDPQVLLAAHPLLALNAEHLSEAALPER